MHALSYFYEYVLICLIKHKNSKNCSGNKFERAAKLFFELVGSELTLKQKAFTPFFVKKDLVYSSRCTTFCPFK